MSIEDMICNDSYTPESRVKALDMYERYINHSVNYNMLVTHLGNYKLPETIKNTALLIAESYLDKIIR